MAGAVRKTTIVEGGNGLATAAAGVMERIGEIEAAPQASQGLLHGRAIFQGAERVGQQMGKHLQHLLAPKP